MDSGMTNQLPKAESANMNTIPTGNLFGTSLVLMSTLDALIRIKNAKTSPATLKICERSKLDNFYLTIV